MIYTSPKNRLSYGKDTRFTSIKGRHEVFYLPIRLQQKRKKKEKKTWSLRIFFIRSGVKKKKKKKGRGGGREVGELDGDVQTNILLIATKIVVHAISLSGRICAFSLMRAGEKKKLCGYHISIENVTREESTRNLTLLFIHLSS